ncbi:MAG: 7,8-didemethyl-8-hydroxy-5-deazariboflavin synthase CofG [Acidobacteria bacterium]|nr:7,8-didemethyl-8-hydroxy-5-deazariboflavin synthase CofG [Acidobacteriota bacterium]
MRDRSKGHTVSFSPKVFLPLTQLCRDFCGYCAYRQTPRQVRQPYMSPEEVLETARVGENLGCKEALFVLGERPEERYFEARHWLRDRGYESSIEYLCQMCALVIRETSLYPHSNPGTLTYRELQALKEVNASLGLMLENTSLRLCGPRGPHEWAPSKHPHKRMETLRLAGELKIPFTTGVLVGIGETAAELVESFEAIRNLQEEYGHIQEVIVQNFRPKPDTPMEHAVEATEAETLRTVAVARIILGDKMNIQVPPNLFATGNSRSYRVFLNAGINDLGGISPATIDYVNPEAPWPRIAFLKEEMKALGYELRPRFPVYPEYLFKESGYLCTTLRNRLIADADKEGYVRQ